MNSAFETWTDKMQALTVFPVALSIELTQPLKTMRSIASAVSPPKSSLMVLRAIW